MEKITSYTNEYIKKVIKLRSRKYREQYNLYFVEGLRAVCDTLDFADVDRILVSQSAYERHGENFAQYSDRVSIVADEVFARVSMLPSEQGVMAVCAIPKFGKPVGKYLIYLDRIRDPGNLGTIIRTAAATGFGVVMDDCVDVYNPKVVRSCVSALNKVNLSYADDITLVELRKQGYTLVAADMHGQSVFEQNVAGNKICIVIGNEAQGISDRILSQVDCIRSLPMEQMESINAAVSAGVMMYCIKFNN